MPYKATYNYKCLNQTYEVGQEYKIDQPLEICKTGFHYCKNAKDVLTHYPLCITFKLLEIEDLSSETIHEFAKSCSNYIRIVREITDPDELFNLLEKYETYDKLGNVLTFKRFDGFSYEYTRDKFGMLLTYRNSDGVLREYTPNQFIDRLSL